MLERLACVAAIVVWVSLAGTSTHSQSASKPDNPDVIPITGDGSITAEELARQKELEDEIREAEEDRLYLMCIMADPGYEGLDEEHDPDPEPCPPKPSPPLTNPEWPESPRQNVDVIPIHGDSSAGVDEVMDSDFAVLPRLRPAAYLRLARPMVSFVSQADGVFEMRVYSSERLTEEYRGRLQHIHLVLTPATAAGAARMNRRVEQAAPRGSGIHLLRVPLRAYCVDFRKLAPAPGDVFLVGRSATQARYAPIRPIRATAEFAATRGYLRPQGDPSAYGRFVTQYAIWTKVEHWNEAQFTRAFVDRTRAALVASHRGWTSETDRTVRALAPARWRDIAIVVNAAARAEARLPVPPVRHPGDHIPGAGPGRRTGDMSVPAGGSLLGGIR